MYSKFQLNISKPSNLEWVTGQEKYAPFSAPISHQ